MCDPATAGYMLMIAATTAQSVNRNQTLRRQDRQAARGIVEQSKKQREANQRVNEQIQALEADTGAGDRAASLADFQQALRADRGAAETGLDNPIGGERFVERAGAGRERLRTAGQDMAERLATISGVLRQRQREGSEFGRLNVDLSALGNDAAAIDYLTRLRIAGEQDNPFVEAGAGALQGYSQALAGRVPTSTPTRRQPIGRGN